MLLRIGEENCQLFKVGREFDFLYKVKGRKEFSLNMKR